MDGSMANNAGDMAAISSHVAGASLHIVPAQGYTDGVDDATVLTDSDFTAENIRNGVDIFGLTGTLVAYFSAGDGILYEKTTTIDITSASPVKKQDVSITYGRNYRIKFSLLRPGPGETSYGQIYKNGVGYGVLRGESAGIWTEFTEDLGFFGGDNIQLYCWTSSATLGYTKNFKICAASPIYTVVL